MSTNLLTIRGIVLKETPVGEADKFITILGKDYGKVSVSVKGAKRVRNGLTAGTSLFSYSDFYIAETKKRMYLNSAEPIETFYNLRNDLSALAYGSYFLEIVNKLLFENMPSNNILLLLLKSLTAVSKNIIPNKLISSIFELKILEYNGYRPEINECINCRKPSDKNFFITFEGTVCENCLAKGCFHIPLNETLLYTIRYILTAELNRLFTFKVSTKTINSLSSFSRHLIKTQLNLNLKSINFLKEIEEFQ